MIHQFNYFAPLEFFLQNVTTTETPFPVKKRSVAAIILHKIKNSVELRKAVFMKSVYKYIFNFKLFLLLYYTNKKLYTIP